MTLPIRYSYSGADCRAVAYFDNDLSYNDLDQKQEIISLDSLATISYSIYEAKSPVRRLGERGVSGYTRGIRTIAGSMVFLVIEDHPLSGLVDLQQKSLNWSRDIDSRGHSFRKAKAGKEKRFVSTLIKPFNIGLFYKTEVAFAYKSEKEALKESNKYEAMKTKNSVKNVEKGYKRGFPDGAHLVISGIDIISEGMVTSVNDMVTEVTMQFVAQDVFNIEQTQFLSSVTSNSAKKKTVKNNG